MPLTAIPGFPHSELLGLYPSWQGVLAQLALLLLFAFAVLKTFWPKRSVTLPTVMPAAPAPAPDAIAAMRAENEELRRRLAALEEAVNRAARERRASVARTATRRVRSSSGLTCGSAHRQLDGMRRDGSRTR